MFVNIPNLHLYASTDFMYNLYKFKYNKSVLLVVCSQCRHNKYCYFLLPLGVFEKYIIIIIIVKS